jgi:pilus assembly protein CpaC
MEPLKSRKYRIWGYRFGLIALLVIAANFAPDVTGRANSDDLAIEAEPITIIIGESVIVQAPWPTVRVAVTDPKIADVKVLTPEQVLLQGVKVGSTDLILWREGEQETWQRKVRVRMDVDHFSSKLKDLFPYCRLQVDQSGEVLIIKGLLRSADQTAQLHGFLDHAGVKYVDMTAVAGVQQVQLQVRVAEVSRTVIRALGFNAFHTDDDYFGGIRVGSASGGALNPSVSMGVEEGTAATEGLPFIFTEDTEVGSLITIFGGSPDLDMEAFIQALAENQYLKILANPTLVALSGEEASFLAGGEFPIPVVQGTGGGTGGGTSISIEYREYGVRLSFRPTVLGDGTIRLHAAPEVSDLTSIGAVTIEGFEIPSLITRRVETTLELKSGQTFAMAGLIKSDVDARASRVPGLSELPILGPLFRSVRYEKGESELVVLVTASLVEPMSLAQTPPLPGFMHADPNDWEFYIGGRIEGRSPAAISAPDAAFLQRMGLDRLWGPGAWDYYQQDAAASRSER